jgi:hypothetical protein
VEGKFGKIASRAIFLLSLVIVPQVEDLKGSVVDRREKFSKIRYLEQISFKQKNV